MTEDREGIASVSDASEEIIGYVMSQWPSGFKCEVDRHMSLRFQNKAIDLATGHHLSLPSVAWRTRFS
jgi:hypothetical protein